MPEVNCDLRIDTGNRIQPDMLHMAFYRCVATAAMAVISAAAPKPTA